MLPEHERSFSPESPVGRYWLINCVGFRVERARRGVGVVERVGRGADGADVLGVRKRGLLRKRLVQVRAERVASVHPWEDTIVLSTRAQRLARRRQERAGTPVRARAADLERRLRPHARAAAAGTTSGLRTGGSALRRGANAVGRVLARAAAIASAQFRAHAPVVRRVVASGAKTTLAMAAAYAAAARRLVEAWAAAFAESIERHRRARAEARALEPPVVAVDEEAAADWPLRAEAEAETATADGEPEPEAEAAVEAPPRRSTG